MNTVKPKVHEKLNLNNIILRFKQAIGLSTDRDIAQFFEISPQSLVNKKKTGTLFYDILNAAVNENINADWLLTGEGKKIRGPGGESTKDGEGISIYKEEAVTPEFRISDALSMTAKVLDSGTSYATALYLNIQHFHRAIEAEARIAQLEANQETMKLSFDRLQSRLDEMEGKIQEHREVNHKRGVAA